MLATSRILFPFLDNIIELLFKSSIDQQLAFIYGIFTLPEEFSNSFYFEFNALFKFFRIKEITCLRL